MVQFWMHGNWYNVWKRRPEPGSAAQRFLADELWQYRRAQCEPVQFLPNACTLSL